MYAHCPDCDTALDQHSGICPACRWDPILSVQPMYGGEPDGTIANRYTTTDLEAGWYAATATRSPVSRSRAVVLVGLVGMATIYGIVLSVLGMV